MAEVIRMPRLSDTMEEGNIVTWLKNVGDDIAVGDILAEVETDKATMDLESFNAGTLLYSVGTGTIPVDGIIAIIGKKGEDFESLLQEDKMPQVKVASEKTDSGKTTKPEPTMQKVSVASPQVQSRDAGPSPQNGRIKASPLARSMAESAGIDISRISGTGEGGRIIKKDVESFISSGGQMMISGQTQSYQVETDVEYGDIPVSQMRKVIARRLSESKFTAPHFYLTIEIDMGRAIEARNDLKKNDIKISFNDLIVKASALALRKHPMINASWNGETITLHRDIHIGVAVAVPDGLLVPVINHADAKPLSVINREVKDLAAKAKEKKLQPDEMSGNTFTISNLGMFGIDEFTAIINAPDVCILAVGSIIEKPIVKDGQIVVGNIMKVTLSCDHRVVDGVTGAKFLDTLRGMLENPIRMLV